MAMNPGYITVEYSGGSGNSDPDASLGGAASGVEADSQGTSAPANVTGVSIRYAALNVTGDGTVRFTSAAAELTWQESSGSEGPAVAVGSDGRYTLYTGDGAGGAADGYVVVDVTSANLPGSDASDTVTVAQLANNLWDDVSRTEAVYGDTEYRCVYIYNRFSSTIFDARVWVEKQPDGNDELDVGLDPAGIGDGSSTGVAQTVGDEDTAPSNVTFSRPIDYSAGVLIGDLDPGQSQAVWLRRTVPTGTSTAVPEDLSRVGFGAQY